MIRVSFKIEDVKKSKGKIDVNLEEITKISAYIKEQSKDLINDLVERKLADSTEGENTGIESQKGGQND